MSGRIDDCWNRIGVRGDGSCPELARHVRCLNCPAFAAGAAQLLDRMAPDDGPAMEYAEIDASPAPATAGASLLLFRVGAEWLGLDSALVSEVTEQRGIHPLPHQRNPAVLGVANIRGMLTLCISLAILLGQEETAAQDTGWEEATARPRRMLVASHDGRGVVFPVTEVHGIQRFADGALQAAPAAVAGAGVRYIQAIAGWRGRSVGVLDGDRLFHALNRSLA